MVQVLYHFNIDLQGDKEKDKEDNASTDGANVAMSLGTSRFVGMLQYFINIK